MVSSVHDTETSVLPRAHTGGAIEVEGFVGGRYKQEYMSCTAAGADIFGGIISE